MSAGELREPWLKVDSQHAEALAMEAMREIAAGHELRGRELAAVTRCSECGDVVFRVSDGTFAIVHLTWSGRSEAPPWPRTIRCGGFMALELAMDQHEH